MNDFKVKKIPESYLFFGETRETAERVEKLRLTLTSRDGKCEYLDYGSDMVFRYKIVRGDDEQEAPQIVHIVFDELHVALLISLLGDFFAKYVAERMHTSDFLVEEK